MEIKNKTLEQLCSFAAKCSESAYGSLERCQDNYIDCEIFNKYLKEEIEKYEVLKTTRNIIVEKLPPGICNGAIETWPERYIPSRMIYASYLIGGGKKLGNRLKKGIPRGLKLL